MPGLRLVTAPAIEPLTITEAKAHLRVDATDEDAVIHGLIRTTRRLVETHTKRQLITATWDLYLDEFPDCGVLKLPFGSLQSVSSVTYTDSSNAATTWSSSNYIVSTAGIVGRIVPVYGGTWPSFTPRPVDALVVRFVCGYGLGAGDVPEEIRHAMLLWLGHLYENREAVVGTPGVTINPHVMPMGVEALLADYVIYDF